MGYTASPWRLLASSHPLLRRLPSPAPAPKVVPKQAWQGCGVAPWDPQLRHRSVRVCQKMAPVCLFLADAARHDGETAESLPFQEQRTNGHPKRKPSQPMGAIVACETRRSDPPFSIHPRVSVHVRRLPPNVRDACRVVTRKKRNRAVVHCGGQRLRRAQTSASTRVRPKIAGTAQHGRVRIRPPMGKSHSRAVEKPGGFLDGLFRQPRILVSCSVFSPVLHRQTRILSSASQLLCNAHSSGGRVASCIR